MSDDRAALPRSLRRGPPITVKCECGERREMRYAQRWECENCGRTYDTSRIPAEEYASFHRNRVHDRIVPTAVVLALTAAIVAFVVIGRPIAAILIFAVVGFGWGTFVRPARRRRQYKAIADRPKWNIKSE